MRSNSCSTAPSCARPPRSTPADNARRERVGERQRERESQGPFALHPPLMLSDRRAAGEREGTAKKVLGTGEGGGQSGRAWSGRWEGGCAGCVLVKDVTGECCLLSSRETFNWNQLGRVDGFPSLIKSTESLFHLRSIVLNGWECKCFEMKWFPGLAQTRLGDPLVVYTGDKGAHAPSSGIALDHESTGDVGPH